MLCLFQRVGASCPILVSLSEWSYNVLCALVWFAVHTGCMMVDPHDGASSDLSCCTQVCGVSSHAWVSGWAGEAELEMLHQSCDVLLILEL